MISRNTYYKAMLASGFSKKKAKEKANKYMRFQHIYYRGLEDDRKSRLLRD